MCVSDGACNRENTKNYNQYQIRMREEKMTKYMALVLQNKEDYLKLLFIFVSSLLIIHLSFAENFWDMGVYHKIINHIFMQSEQLIDS